ASWFAQVNYIFSLLKVGSNHEDYSVSSSSCLCHIYHSPCQPVTELVHQVEISIRISKATHNPPDGYLFVWSPEPFEAGPTLIHWSADAAYWSLDPSGSNKLSHEESSRLGFPSIELRINVYALSWDETVYAGLRKFDECKGFDPESQDVARELGYPLFKVDVLGSAVTRDVVNEKFGGLKIDLEIWIP
ncbi:hypothetical protein B0H14DRAFT_3671391, partial [Mycena olivaceomarginata]